MREVFEEGRLRARMFYVLDIGVTHAKALRDEMLREALRHERVKER